MTEPEHTSCPYCNEEFDSEYERGVHISEEHTDTEKKIPKRLC